MYKTDAPAQNR